MMNFLEEGWEEHKLSLGRDGGIGIGSGKGHKIGELNEY